MWFDQLRPARRTGWRPLSMLAVAGAVWGFAAAGRCGADLIGGPPPWSAWAAPPPSCRWLFLCSRLVSEPGEARDRALLGVSPPSNIGTLARGHAACLDRREPSAGQQRLFLGLAAVTVLVALAFYRHRARTGRPNFRARADGPAGNPSVRSPRGCWKSGRRPRPRTGARHAFLRPTPPCSPCWVCGAGPYLYGRL